MDEATPSSGSNNTAHSWDKPRGQFSESEESILSRALGYPYARPAYSYLYRNGTAQALHKVPRNRHFVLAIGSNGAPGQLWRKYGEDIMPVVAVEAQGLDVVYAAMLAEYGSIPATVVRRAGCVVRLHATLLDERQLRVMHATEGGYEVCRVVEGRGVRVVWDGKEVRDVVCYVAKTGALKMGGEVFGIKEIGGDGRGVCLRQREVQEVVMGMVGWEGRVEEFVLRNVECVERRREVVGKMERLEGLEDCFQVVGKEVEEAFES